MTRTVRLSIKGLYMAANSENTDMETVTLATYFKKNGSHYLLYEEAAEVLEKPTQNRIKFRENLLELTRKGSVAAHMIFEEHKKYVTNYTTPYGNFLMGIDTGKVQVEETEEHIRITVEYALEIDEEPLSHCKISICICEWKENEL